MSGWRVRHAEHEFIPNVVPVDDMREHEPGTGCWCEPTLDDGVIIHNSMDNREAYERGERKPS